VSTWVGLLVETKGDAGFWEIARQLGVVRQTSERPGPWVLIDCDAGFDFLASVRLAQALSTETGGVAIGFLLQTAVDVHEIHVFRGGEEIRTLVYNRDDAGWQKVEGEPQPWEADYFFDGGSTRKGSDSWPDLLGDETSPEDRARYEDAARLKDAGKIMDLLHPSSASPMNRVCQALGAKGDAPAGRWRRKSFWRRIFGG
jgi:hypothetical protein